MKKILRGHQRVETDRIIAFRSHWGFQSEYCNPASGNEKGGVEGELGWFRRNWLVPVPEASGSGGVEPTAAGRLPGEPKPHHQRQKHDDRSRPASRSARILLPLAEEGFPIEEVTVSADRGRQGPREGEDQLVLGAAAGRGCA